MLIVGNWKAYVENPESAKKLMATAKRFAGKSRHKFVVVPPAPYISLLSGAARSKVLVGVQDVSDGTGGALTGEVPAVIARRAGASYAIIGHSERRARGETDAVVAEKTVRALSAGLIPIVCVGEKERDHDARYLQELRTQMTAIFSKLQPKDRVHVVVAYEPIWAIGKSSGDAIASSDLAEMVLYIRKLLTQHVPPKDVAKMKILYGGSVDPANIRGLAKESTVDGFLIGRASTDPKVFSALVKALS